jgi:sporulation protein YlmC with PRC-barrel domain
MDLRIKDRTDVFTADGDRVGSVDRVVIDPLTDTVSHIVVRKGLFFKEDKVIPADAIVTATEARINLSPDASADDFPLFEERHYVPVTPSVLDPRAGPRGALPLAYYGPHGVAVPGNIGITQTVVHRNVPERAVALQAGAAVFDPGGDEVGRFEELIMTSTGVATHLVVHLNDTGVRKAIPLGWLDAIGEDEVRIGVVSGMVESIPEYEPTDPRFVL